MLSKLARALDNLPRDQLFPLDRVENLPRSGNVAALCVHVDERVRHERVFRETRFDDVAVDFFADPNRTEPSAGFESPGKSVLVGAHSLLGHLEVEGQGVLVRAGVLVSRDEGVPYESASVGHLVEHLVCILEFARAGVEAEKLGGYALVLAEESFGYELVDPEAAEAGFEEGGEGLGVVEDDTVFGCGFELVDDGIECVDSGFGLGFPGG
ncbi:NAD(P)-binding Rossmann-fold superfamily protein [Striga asiatica]|uniref:NAD(P)-binding Rossmann-fold superfamily protein n=1 Tax=Striga asiatica TaxID=4170 RepID=A0A5A7PQV6_STRAF|nr:NAD(P)-binding Rossmann-fold superfamily protein [Striga asiatica]